MKGRKRSLAGALVLVLLLAAAAWGGHRGQGFGDRFSSFEEPPFPRLHALRLTQAQVDQITAVLEKYEDEHAMLRRQMRDERLALHEAVHSDPFDEEEIRAAAQALGEQLGELSVHRARVLSEIRLVLTPEQLEQLSEMKESFRQKRECRRQLHRAIRDYIRVGE